jgi:predicted kinase
VKARLIIVCGLPGSGKTTVAQALEHDFSAVRLSPDDWMDALSIDLYDEESRQRIEALQWTLAQRVLALGMVVIIEWGTWARAERDALRLRARELGAAVELRYVSAAPDTLFQRIRKRDRENPPITQEDVAKWFAILQRPTTEEMALFDPPLEADSPKRRAESQQQ